MRRKPYSVLTQAARDLRAMRECFSAIPSTTTLRKDYWACRQHLPPLPEQFANKAEIMRRKLASPMAKQVPRRVADVKEGMMIRFSIRSISVVFTTVMYSESQDVATAARLADCAAYFFRYDRARHFAHGSGYNFSEEQAKADSEIPQVAAVLNGFKKNLEESGIIHPDRESNYQKLKESLKKHQPEIPSIEDYNRERDARDKEWRERWEKADKQFADVNRRLEQLEKSKTPVAPGVSYCAGGPIPEKKVTSEDAQEAWSANAKF